MLKKKNELRHFSELLFLLVQKELKVRYKNSILGYVWALANPFAFALVYYIAFKLIMRVDMPNYSIFLLTGMFPWVWLSNSLTQATQSYRCNASLVKKVKLNRAVLPLSNVIHEMVHFIFALPILILFILFSGDSVYVSWVWQIPLMILLQVLLIYPVALLLALANVYAHDVEYLISILLSMLFFLTPIVYPISMIPEIYLKYFEMSPLTLLTKNWRDVFLTGEIALHSYLVCLGLVFCFSTFSIWIYRKSAHKIGELL